MEPPDAQATIVQGLFVEKKTRTGTGFSYHAPHWEEEIYLELFERASEGDEGFKRNQYIGELCVKVI